MNNNNKKRRDKMVRFIVATHGKFAEGIKTSIELIIGNIDNLEILNCYTTQSFN